jgi:apolipoprotein N-acyltransferase
VIGHGADGVDRNSAVLIDHEGRVLSRYDKVNLVPFGEFVPWGLGPIAFKISKEAGDFGSGTEQVVSETGAHKLATFICYESVFPRFIRGFVNRGAEVLINPSNDGWFAKTAARFQHLEIVRMRAAENQRWVLRATNDGISAAIDDAGRIREELPIYREASQAVAFEYEKQLTLYTRWGDWFVAVCAVILALSYAESRVRRRP